VHRHANFSVSDLIHPAQNKKIFQHIPIDFIHTNAMNPFSKLTNGEKAMKYRYKLYRFFKKLCVALPTFQRHIYSIQLRTGRFFTTD